MNKNLLGKGKIQENSSGIGEVSGEMVEGRARELALIVGRPVTKQDREQALRELRGGDGMDAKQAMLESIPEEQRWDPMTSSVGPKAEDPASEDEDEDGRDQFSQLVEEGVCEAAHDQMVQAAIASAQTRHTPPQHA